MHFVKEIVGRERALLRITPLDRMKCKKTFDRKRGRALACLTTNFFKKKKGVCMSIARLLGVGNFEARLEAESRAFQSALEATALAIQEWDAQLTPRQAPPIRQASPQAPTQPWITQANVYATIDNLGRAQTLWTAGRAVWSWYSGT